MKKKGILVLCLLISLVFYAQVDEGGVLDSDNDGVINKKDKCPRVVGLISNNGCPKPPYSFKSPIIYCGLINRLEEFNRVIYFKHNKSKLNSEIITNSKLDWIVEIMKKYSKSNFTIEGHADNKEKRSQVLSEKRAKAVLNYLLAKGVDSNRLSSIGYGEDYPIADNATRDGRSSNRRVEIKLRK